MYNPYDDEQNMHIHQLDIIDESSYDDEEYEQYEDEKLDDDLFDSEPTETIKVGICAMAKKVQSKPMQEVLNRLKDYYDYFEIITFDEDMILHKPIEEWHKCDCLISFYSKDFPLEKAQSYAKKYNPFLINDLDKQWDIMDRTKVYQILKEAGIEQPRFVIKHNKKDTIVEEQDDQIIINGEAFTKPFVEKPTNADDHNIYIYFPSSAGGGSQRLFRKVCLKVGSRSSTYSPENRIRKNGSFIYEEFMPTDGTDVKVYTVGPEYAHAEGRKAPALDGVVERDENGKEVRYPIILRAEEKIIARKIVLAFKQSVCGFDLLRAYGKSYVCDVNGFSFVKNSTKYYDDCGFILANMIMKAIAPQRQIPNVISYETEDPPIVPTSFGTMMELRCIVAVIRHGDRTPKQKMKMEVKNKLFFQLFEKYDGKKKGNLKLKQPSQLQEVLDIARTLLLQCDKLNLETLETKETKTKLSQLKTVLEMYGHFSGINRKVQFKFQPKGKPRNSSSEEDAPEIEQTPSLLLILKWGGELTAFGKAQAEDLGNAFRKLYPGSKGNYANNNNKSDAGFLRLHSTFRHDLKIYASDEGRVQMTAAAFAKGLLALEGELAPILVQMVKSANTNGLLDNDSMSAAYQEDVKTKLKDYLSVDKDFTEEDIENIAPTKSHSILSALKAVKNPMEMCKKVYGYIKELTNLIRNKITEAKSYETKLYHTETWELMLRRWSKLEKDFYDKKMGKFEISKIPDIYDCIKYDLMHNQNVLKFDHAAELHASSKALADVVIPQEYGITHDEKLKIAQGIIAPLLEKIRIDLKSNLTGIWNGEEDTVNKLNASYSKGIQTPGRHVRTRLYFTSESHVYSLLNILKHGNLFGGQDELWKRAIDYLNTVPELNYLTQIVIMLYEDTSVDPESDKRFHIELHFSPGAYGYDKQQEEPPPKPPKAESQESIRSNLSDKSTDAIVQQSPTQLAPMSAIANKHTDHTLVRQYIHEKKHANFSQMKKHFKAFINDIKPLPENSTAPVEIQTTKHKHKTSQSHSHSDKNSISEDQNDDDDSKPRSFEDNNNRIDFIKTKSKSIESYCHYNTFHGSATPSIYTPIAKLFNPRLSLGTNSTPDLNQNMLDKTRGSSTMYQEFSKIRQMTPLETLHNNLCFKALDAFFAPLATHNTEKLLTEFGEETKYENIDDRRHSVSTLLHYYNKNPNNYKNQEVIKFIVNPDSKMPE